MRWGLTKHEADKLRADKGRPWEWHPAPIKLFPVRLIDGDWAWMEPMDRCSGYALQLGRTAVRHTDGFCYRIRASLPPSRPRKPEPPQIDSNGNTCGVNCACTIGECEFHP